MEKEGNGAEAPALAAADMQHSHKPRQTSAEGPSQIVIILQMCSVMPDVIIDGVKRIADAVLTASAPPRADLAAGLRFTL